MALQANQVQVAQAKHPGNPEGAFRKEALRIVQVAQMDLSREAGLGEDCEAGVFESGLG